MLKVIKLWGCTGKLINIFGNQINASYNCIIVLYCFCSDIFIDKPPHYKKIRTYAKQKPIRFKRHLTDEVDYENIFTIGELNNLNFNIKSITYLRYQKDLLSYCIAGKFGGGKVWWIYSFWAFGKKSLANE